mmetsp:Transcript_63052/g.117988  ORF Transcript_63052/g.117988 Transcript_63052/m.117988 type:complete len:320 (-) Transcript_63052:2-961(-)
MLERIGIKCEEALQLVKTRRTHLGRRLRKLDLHLLVLPAEVGLYHQTSDHLREARQNHHSGRDADGPRPEPQARNGLAGVVPVVVLREGSNAEHRQQHQKRLKQVTNDIHVQVRWDQETGQQHRKRREVGSQCCIIIQQHHELLHLQSPRHGAQAVGQLGHDKSLGFVRDGSHLVGNDALHLHALGSFGPQIRHSALQEELHDVLVILQSRTLLLRCRGLGILDASLLQRPGRGSGRPEEDQAGRKRNAANHGQNVELGSERFGCLPRGQDRVLRQELLVSNVQGRSRGRQGKEEPTGHRNRGLGNASLTTLNFNGTEC